MLPLCASLHDHPMKQIGFIEINEQSRSKYRIYFRDILHNKFIKLDVNRNTHDMSIRKLLQISISNYELLLFFFPIRI